MTMEQIKKDVVVVGGGPGGFAAAVTAARAGAQVLLVERNGYLGGQLGSGLPFLAFWDIKGRQVVVLLRNLWTGWSRQEHPMDMSIAHTTSPLH